MSLTEVCAVADEQSALLVRGRARDRCPHIAREAREELGVTVARIMSFAFVLELPPGELPDRLEHPVAVMAGLVDPVADEALVEERLEDVEVGSRNRYAAASVQPPANTERARSTPCSSLAEKVVRPGDGRLQRPLPLFDVAVR